MSNNYIILLLQHCSLYRTHFLLLHHTFSFTTEHQRTIASHEQRRVLCGLQFDRPDSCLEFLAKVCGKRVADIINKHDCPFKWTGGEDNFVEEMQTFQKKKKKQQQQIYLLQSSTTAIKKSKRYKSNRYISSRTTHSTVLN